MKKILATLSSVLLLIGLSNMDMAFGQQAQASFITLTGAGDKYIKPVNNLWGLQWKGLATSTNGVLCVNSDGWVTPVGCVAGAPSTDKWATSTNSTDIQPNVGQGLNVNASSTFTSNVQFTGPLYASSTSLFSSGLMAYASSTLQNTTTGILRALGAFYASTTALFTEGFTAYSSSTLQSFTASNGTTTNATSTNFAISSLTSALIQTGADGSTAEYAGTSCTNQFVRSLSVLGIATCETVQNTDLANSSLTINGSSVSLGGSITVSSTTLLTDNNSFSGITKFVDSLFASSTSLFTNGFTAYASSTLQRINVGGVARFLDNVGIGATTTPAAKLSVAGTAGGTTPLFLVSSSTAAFATTTVFSIDSNGLLTQKANAIFEGGIATSTSGASNGAFLARLTNIVMASTTGATNWTKPSRLSYIVVKAWGGGAGGGADVGDCAGGGGAYSEELLFDNELSSSETVTVGAGGAAETDGGDSTFGSHLTAGGGKTTTTAFCGALSTASGGDINLPGFFGNVGVAGATVGAGGGSPFSGSAGHTGAFTANGGANAGQGGTSSNGAGGNGLILIYEYTY